MKMSSDHQIIALFSEIKLAISNGDVRVLIGSCEIAICAHAQYRVGQNSQERLTRRRAASSCNAFAIATFSTFSFYHISFFILMSYVTKKLAFERTLKHHL